jgi:hypothetical protein
MGIREGCPDLREAISHGLAACVPRAADVRARRGFENAVFRHERHEGIDIVVIPRIGKGLQESYGDLNNHIRHDLAPPLSVCTGTRSSDAQRAR